MKCACPYCNTEYDVEDSLIYQEAECAICHRNFIIEKAEEREHSYMFQQPEPPAENPIKKRGNFRFAIPKNSLILNIIALILFIVIYAPAVFWYFAFVKRLEPTAVQIENFHKLECADFNIQQLDSIINKLKDKAAENQRSIAIANRYNNSYEIDHYSAYLRDKELRKVRYSMGKVKPQYFQSNPRIVNMAEIEWQVHKHDASLLASFYELKKKYAAEVILLSEKNAKDPAVQEKRVAICRLLFIIAGIVSLIFLVPMSITNIFFIIKHLWKARVQAQQHEMA